MPTIFSRLEEFYSYLLIVLSKYPSVDEGHGFSWPNHVFQSRTFRRAHLDVVDAREAKKLYMMHLCIFPHTNDPAPIFGFDIIAGPKKVTGAFHDFSPVCDEHPLTNAFYEAVSHLEWSKPRDLPHWAKQIFSPKIVAAGNIQTLDELDVLLKVVSTNLETFLKGLGNFEEQDYRNQHNKYCYWQQQNPHTPKVMAALGLPDLEVERFISKCLFPSV